MDKLLYISTGIPKEEVDTLRKKQIDFSTNAMQPISVFHGNILSGLSTVYGEVCALSGVPISRKHYKVFRYPGKNLEKGNVRYIIPGFFNIPVVKQLTVIVKIWLQIITWYGKNKSHNCHILIDGTFYSGLISLWLASKFVRVPKGAILVDYYPFMDPKREKLSNKVFYKALSCVDGFVFVTEHLEKLVNRNNKKYMLMEGLVNTLHNVESVESVGDFCVYAGGLHGIYGVKNLVNAFSKSELPYTLHLYGSGELVDYIKQVGEKDGRIVYKGLLPHDELLKIERGAKLLVNPRPVRGKLDTRFNFPSKLMEYMQSGRPVLTTRLLGIPREYEGRMYFFEGDSEEEIKEGLEKVLSMPEETLAAFGLQAQKYVNANKNNVAVGRKIFELINQEDHC